MMIGMEKVLWSGQEVETKFLDWPCLHSSCRRWWHFSDTSASIFLVCVKFCIWRKKRTVFNLFSPPVSLSATHSLPPSSVPLTPTPFPSFFLTACSLKLSFPTSPPLSRYFWLPKGLWQQDVISHLLQHFQLHKKCQFFFSSSSFSSFFLLEAI